ncbi:MAG: ABC transporter [Anaerolineae bacterium CG2_30_64_16]|nr:MAG: ABC transporter [Anaerolineae bacterium CG2_30_64_16]
MHIETTALRKQYGALTAVDSLDLRVDAGEVFGFLGPNGAGKTTTVKMLLGLVYPDGGAARVLGQRPGDPHVMGRIGFLPEHFRFPPWLTAAGFLDLHGRLYGMPAARRRTRIPKLLERVGLADRAHSRLGEFSKGMSQRIGLAQALLNEPDLVFLDEPTSGLDPVGRREVRDLIRELRDAGVTVFLNSHFLSEVEVTCDRMAIVKRGRVVRSGTLDQLTDGAVEVQVRAGGLTPDLVAGLARWGRVISDFGFRISDCQDVVRFTLTVESEAVLPAVADWLVQGGARLYALAPQRPSLDELFMRIIAEEP